MSCANNPFKFASAPDPFKQLIVERVTQDPPQVLPQDCFQRRQHRKVFALNAKAPRQPFRAGRGHVNHAGCFSRRRALRFHAARQIRRNDRIGRCARADRGHVNSQVTGNAGIKQRRNRRCESVCPVVAGALVNAPAVRVLGYCGEVPTEPYTAYGGEPENSLKWDSGVIEFANGVACLFEKPPRVFPSSHITFPTGWEIEGTKGNLSRDVFVQYTADQSLSFPIEERYTEQDGARVLDSLAVAAEPPVVWDNPYKRYGIATQDDAAKADILTSFHRAITESGQPQYGVAEGVRDYELCLAVRESADRGNTWVELPLTEPTALEVQIEAEFLRRYGHDPIEETEALLDAPFTRSATLWPLAHWL